jgi:hypothetical protein
LSCGSILSTTSSCRLNASSLMATMLDGVTGLGVNEPTSRVAVLVSVESGRSAVLTVT